MRAESKQDAMSDELDQYATTEERLVETLHTLATQNDTPYVIVAASALEDLLAMVLCETTQDSKLFGSRGRFSTFSAKIEIAYACKSIDGKLFNDINAIRNVTNAFAHARGPLQFGSSNPILNEALKGFSGWTESSDQRVLFDERLNACIQALSSLVDSAIFIQAWSDAL
jgi:hypothetical protein